MRLQTLLVAAGLRGARITDGWGQPDEGAGLVGPEIVDIAISSSAVAAGTLFACVPGQHADGHDFAQVAVQRGAVALLCERPVQLPVSVPQVVVASVRAALGPLSAAFWGRPARFMKVVGVTGTTGKTTTCALLASIFRAYGWRSAVIGTLTGERTTPEAPVLQRRLAELLREGTAAVAMEVSSHALDQHRADGTELVAAVFTNLSQDHLDYHGTMESYFEAKAALFKPGWAPLAVVNRDDEWGARLARRVAEAGPGAPQLVTYSPDDAIDVHVGPERASFKWRGQKLELGMGGRFNVANAVAAATTAETLGVPIDGIQEGLLSVPPVRGRFEVVEAGPPFHVIVDFAHTPAALGAALRAARELSGKAPLGRVVLVFGAGGERDRGKRPAMGEVASRLADVCFLTSDNPRGEDPLGIIAEVASGAAPGALVIEPDRAKAIEKALAAARPGDVVVIAGKGHETGQDFGDHVEPFNDAEVAREVLRCLRGGGAGPAAVAPKVG
ncbi:MAG: UDP-N-acetylmuramoyl-L-alanyl-D-glutamate--2,6-diaminopimelate ligase [Acidimicrobiales bacterium]